MNEDVVLPLLDKPMCMLESLKILAVLERVGQGIDLREGQGMKNTGRVNCKTRADALFFHSIRNKYQEEGTLCAEL